MSPTRCRNGVELESVVDGEITGYGLPTVIVRCLLYTQEIRLIAIVAITETLWCCAICQWQLHQAMSIVCEQLAEHEYSKEMPGNYYEENPMSHPVLDLWISFSIMSKSLETGCCLS